MRRKIKFILIIISIELIIIGLFSMKLYALNLNDCIQEKTAISDDEFIIENGELKKYIGEDKIVLIPNNVYEIGNHAFFHNNNIEKIIIPSSVKSVKEAAFSECKI